MSHRHLQANLHSGRIWLGKVQTPICPLIHRVSLSGPWVLASALQFCSLIISSQRGCKCLWKAQTVRRSEFQQALLHAQGHIFHHGLQPYFIQQQRPQPLALSSTRTNTTSSSVKNSENSSATCNTEDGWECITFLPYTEFKPFLSDHSSQILLM